MAGIVLAWLVGEGIIVYRSIKTRHAPPGPGQLLWSSGIFALLGIIGQAQQARALATLLAWGFDIGAFLALYDPENPFNLESVERRSLGYHSEWPPEKLPDTVIFPGQLPPTGTLS